MAHLNTEHSGVAGGADFGRVRRGQAARQRDGPARPGKQVNKVLLHLALYHKTRFILITSRYENVFYQTKNRQSNSEFLVLFKIKSLFQSSFATE